MSSGSEEEEDYQHTNHQTPERYKGDKPGVRRQVYVARVRTAGDLWGVRALGQTQTGTKEGLKLIEGASPPLIFAFPTLTRVYYWINPKVTGMVVQVRKHAGIICVSEQNMVT